MINLKKTGLFLFCLVAVLSLALSSAAIELIYPEDGSWVPYSHLLIIKTGEDPPVAGVSLEINGAKSDILDISSDAYRAAFADFLLLEPSFEPGKNSITLMAHDASGKQIGETKADIYYKSDPYERPPDDFRHYVMHTSQREALCAPCHNMQPTQQQLLESSVEKNPCGTCHRRMLKRKYVHGPAGVFECTFCHDPASRPSKYRYRAGDAKICTECHEEKVEEFSSNEFVHGPVAVGMCSVCHDPHATNFPAQLFRETNVVCIGCHEGVDLNNHVIRSMGGKHPLKGVPDPSSSSGRELSCASCHRPHGGASRVFFSSGTGSAMMLCQQCHQK